MRILGVKINEISAVEIAVAITFPYCLKSSPLESLIEIIAKVSPVKIAQ